MSKELPILGQDHQYRGGMAGAETGERVEWANKYNPFNSDKLFATADRWRTIKRGEPIAPPRTVSIDPMNFCDEACVFCNSDFIMDINKGSRLTKETMDEIPDFLYKWNDCRCRNIFGNHVNSISKNDRAT